MAYYKFMTAVLCGLFCSSRAGETSDCSAGWFYDLHCYQVQLGRSDWTTAQSNCRDRKANLASIHSEMEDVLIWSQLPRGRKFWIGLSRFESTTMPSWADSSSVVFTYWAKNEPNRLNKTCTYIQPEDGKWKAIECDAKLLVDGYICKRPLDILLSPLSVNNSHGCLLGSYAYDRICYTWYNETRSWDDAQKLCQMLNGSLATVPDKLTQAFISSVFGPWISPYWVGVTMRNGSYQWVTGRPVQSSSHFTHGCLAMIPSLQLWESLNCSDQLPFVCETQRKDLTTDDSYFHKESLPLCPSNWTQKDDVCYRYFSQQSTWHTAQSNCQSHGGHLISIHDDRTQSFIFSLMIRQKPISPIWLGLNDASVESRYQWSDESPFDFTLWSRGEPNSLSVSEDCTEMLPTDGKWNDNNCHVVRPYICAIQRSRPTPGIQTTLITVEEMVPECADKDWSYHDSFCYYIGTDFKSWNKARKYCVSKGGDLASILSEDESNFIINLQSKNSIRDVWIGLNKKNQDYYVWSDGSHTEYLAWYPTQPKDVEGSELCVTMKIDHGRWFNSRCFKALNFLCKKKNGSNEVLHSSPSPIIDGSCPNGFVGLNKSNKCYYVSGVVRGPKLAWNRAREVCNEMISTANVVLASINGPQEQEFIAELISPYPTNYWIGLRDFFEDGIYSWMDGSEVVYTYWAEGQPLTVNPHTFSHKNYPYRFSKSGHKLLNENFPALLPCVEIIGTNLSTDNTKWSSAECDKKNSYICQTFKIQSTLTNDITKARNDITSSRNDITSSRNDITSSRNDSTAIQPIKFGNLSYLVSDKEWVSWPEAEHNCHIVGMQLVSFHSTHQVQSLLDNVIHTSSTDQSEQQQRLFWIGLFVNDKGLFQWSDGTRATYSNWDIGQPSVNTQGKCVTLNTRTGKWTDIDCLTHRLGFICTYKENSDTDMVPDEKTNNTNSQTAALVLGVQIVSVCVILIAVILFITLRKSRKTSHSAANKNSFPTIVYLPKQECDGVRT